MVGLCTWREELKTTAKVIGCGKRVFTWLWLWHYMSECAPHGWWHTADVTPLQKWKPQVSRTTSDKFDWHANECDGQSGSFWPRGFLWARHQIDTWHKPKYWDNKPHNVPGLPVWLRIKMAFVFFSPLQRYTNRLVAPRLHLSVGTQSVKQNKRYCRLMFQSHFPPVSLLILFFFACFLISPQTTFTFAARPLPPASSSTLPLPPSSLALITLVLYFKLGLL